MAVSVRLTSNLLSAPYAMSENDWTAISKRVGGVLVIASDTGYKEKMPHVFPHWDELLQSCQQWKTTTFPALEEQARALHDYASQAIQDFQLLKREIDSMEKDATSVPGNIVQEVKATIEWLQQSTIRLGEAFSNLADQISVFRGANERFDADVDALKERDVTPWWEKVWGSTQAIEHATSLVLGEWRAIASDLEDVVAGEIDITPAFLMGLDIEIALKSWNRILTETETFSNIAGGQQKYLTGKWLLP